MIKYCLQIQIIKMDGQRGNFYLYHSMDHHWQSFHRDLPNNQPLFYTGDMVCCNTNGFLPAGFSAPKIKAEPKHMEYHNFSEQRKR